MERLTTLPAPEGYPATFGARSVSIEQQISGLLEVLNVIRSDMTQGTAQNLGLMVQQLDTAIRIGREVVLMLEARAARSRSNRDESGHWRIGHNV